MIFMSNVAHLGCSDFSSKLVRIYNVIYKDGEFFLKPEEIVCVSLMTNSTDYSISLIVFRKSIFQVEDLN